MRRSSVLHEAFVDREVVAYSVLPGLGSRLVVGVVLGRETVDVAYQRSTGRLRQDGLSDEREVGNGWLVAGLGTLLLPLLTRGR